MIELPFVAREPELDRLHAALEAALEGHGQLRFVTGEAGAGKTSLTAEFARQAQNRQDELLWVVGNCNAQSGIGDPYLPFREVMGQLTGDVDAKLSQGAISEENAGRLRQFLNFSGRAVVDLGPDLIDIFVPGAALVSRASRLVAGEVGWRRKLQDLNTERAARPKGELSSRGGQVQLEQNHIFEQFTRVLVELARIQPLVLLLDDLHWADESSASLLFHLARRIDGSRILVLGTFRPEDVALGRGERRHPLEPVVNEIKRLHGEVVLALGQEDEAAGRAFIDALLDARPNRLDAGFRRQLYRHTRGHPLFTTELLAGMQGRGDLLTDAGGHLVRGATLDWDTLPARIEGVLEERIHRIPAGLQELLTVAAVEGETFTAQVVAAVLGRPEREVLQALERQLDQQFQVVQEDSLHRVGRQRVSRWRFRHNLIQRYLYNTVGESRSGLLHEDVARALASLHGGQREDVAHLLARHFELAGLPEEAADQYLVVGRRALRMFAGEEAVDMLNRGLELLATAPDDDDTGRRRLALQLALGKARWKLGQADQSMEVFQQAAATARAVGDAEALACAAVGYDDPRYRFGLPSAPAVRLYEEALNSLGDGDSTLRVQVICGLIRARGHAMIPVVLKTLTEQAIAMARRLEGPQALYIALLTRALAYPEPERLAEREALLDESAALARQLSDEVAWLDTAVFQLDCRLARGDLAAADELLAEMQSVVEEVGEPFYQYCLVTKQAMRALLGGDFEMAERLARRGMECGLPMQLDSAEGVFGMQMFSIRRLQGGLRALAPVIAHFVRTHSDAASWRPGLALVHAEIGDVESARAEFNALAPGDFAAVPRDSLWPTCLSYLADVCCCIGDAERARVLYRLLEPYAGQAIVVGNSITVNGAASRSLARLAALLDDAEAADRHFRHALAFNEKLQAWPWLAKTLLQSAQWRLSRGSAPDVGEAGAELARAEELATRLGMAALLQDVHRLQRGNAGHD